MRTRPIQLFLAVLGSALVLTACGSSDSEGGDRPGEAGKVVTIATHDSWGMDKKVMAAFTAQTGITVRIAKQGDAGQLTNKLVLTKGNPIADGVFGIDNTFASRAIDEGVLDKYVTEDRPSSVAEFDLEGDNAAYLNPIDYGDVCVNIDDTWPALRPGVVSAASVVFLFCSTAFGVVLTLGGLKYANVETEIYLLTTQELDLTAAAALSILQLVVITVLLAASHRARRAVSPAGAAASARRRIRLRDTWLLTWTAVVIAFLLLPILTLLLASLRTPDGWGLDHYRALQGTGADNALLVPATEALARSLVVACQAATFALALGAIVAFLVSRPTRTRAAGRLRTAFDGVFMLPLGVSAVTLGFGFLITLDSPPLDLRASPWLVPIAQAMVALPLVVRTVSPVLSSIDARQREAASSLGAGTWRVLMAVDLQVAWRALLAAAGFAFAVSLGEFGATSFLARDDNPTLPVVIFQLISHPGAANFGMATAACVVLAATTAGVMLLVEQLRVGSVGAF